MFNSIITWELLHTIRNIDELLSILKPLQLDNEDIYDNAKYCKKIIKTPQYVYIDKPKSGINNIFLVDHLKHYLFDKNLKLEDKLKSKPKIIITKLQKLHITDLINYRWILQKSDKPYGGIGMLMTLGTIRYKSIRPILIANYNNNMYDLTLIVKNFIINKLKKNINLVKK